MEHPLVTSARGLLQQHKGRWPEIAEAADVSYSWVAQFARGKIPNPTVDNLQAVIDACKGRVMARKEARAA